MTLLPDQAVKIKERYQARLVESSWVILDMMQGAKTSKLRFTVEIQARWATEMLNEAFRDGLQIGKANGEKR